MYKIQPSSDPYSPLIANAIAREYPTQCVANQDNLIDLLTAEIVGTKQYRYGPRPNPESLVAIRDAIRSYVNANLPIPFLVPWGSLKPDGSSIDLAELWGLKMLRCLNSRVSGHYAPGIQINIRVEDASAPNIFFDRIEETRTQSRVYATAFETLIHALELYPSIAAIRESTVIDEEKFTAEAEEILPAMMMVLTEPSNIHGHKQLGDWGWKGRISGEMEQFYYTQYDKLYPNDSRDQHRYRLARYLSGSLARRRLRVTGEDPGWLGKYIELSFMPPVPSTGAYFGRRIYYRTIPSRLTANHMPPWRSKGYMFIRDEEDPRPKLASFNKPTQYNPNTVRIVNGDTFVDVRADYIIN